MNELFGMRLGHNILQNSTKDLPVLMSVPEFRVGMKYYYAQICFPRFFFYDCRHVVCHFTTLRKIGAI